MKNIEIERFARNVLAKYTGCKVTLNSISLLEASTFSEMVTYVYFRVNCVEYAYYANLRGEEFYIHPFSDYKIELKYAPDWA